MASLEWQQPVSCWSLGLVDTALSTGLSVAQGWKSDLIGTCSCSFAYSHCRLCTLQWEGSSRSSHKCRLRWDRVQTSQPEVKAKHATAAKLLQFSQASFTECCYYKVLDKCRLNGGDKCTPNGKIKSYLKKNPGPTTKRTNFHGNLFFFKPNNSHACDRLSQNLRGQIFAMSSGLGNSFITNKEK